MFRFIFSHSSETLKDKKGMIVRGRSLPYISRNHGGNQVFLRGLLGQIFGIFCILQVGNFLLNGLRWRPHVLIVSHFFHSLPLYICTSFFFYSLKQHTEDIMKTSTCKRQTMKQHKANAKSEYIANTTRSIHAKSAFIQHSYQM